MHQNDGGLLVKHPQILGDGVGGTVVEVGPDAKRLKVGDKVFGFSWRNQVSFVISASAWWRTYELKDYY